MTTKITYLTFKADYIKSLTSCSFKLAGLRRKTAVEEKLALKNLGLSITGDYYMYLLLHRNKIAKTF